MRERALEGALYAEDKFTLTSYMSLNVGMRMSAFYAYGNQNFVIYDPDFPRSRSSVTDTIVLSMVIYQANMPDRSSEYP